MRKTFRKIQRLRWAEQFGQSQQNNPSRRIFVSQSGGGKWRDGPKFRGKDGVGQNAWKVCGANWQRLAMNRTD